MRLIRSPRPKSVQKLRGALRPITKRCNGRSLEEIIRLVNLHLRGWFEYFKHACNSAMAETDQWVRARLRSILRKRSGRKGRGRGSDHQLWTNAYFTERGLFSCVTARAQACQSVTR